MQKVVIIGGGHAGIQCAMKLREYGFSGQIQVLSEETYFPYHRPPLSKKFLTGEVSEEELYIFNPEVIEKNQIEMIFNTHVLEVDHLQKVVKTADKTYAFDQLVVASGAAPRRLDLPELQGVENLCYCRNIADIHKIANHLDQVEHVAIIGGGYIGLELAATLKKLGKNVGLIEKAPRILQRVASEQTAAYIKQEHHVQGVSVFENTGVNHYQVEGHQIRALELDNGQTLPCDLLIVGIGVIPNTAFLSDDFEKVNGSLLVNECCQTNQKDVYAIGDCTIFYLDQDLTKLESIQNANEQADIAARAMTGQSVQYAPKPWFWSDQYELKIQIAGLARGYDQVLSRLSADKASFWYLNGSKLVAVDSVNDARSFMIGKKFVGSNVADLSKITDPDADLKSNFV